MCLKDKAIRNRARRFGVTEEEFRGLYDGSCWICGVPGPIDGKKGLAMDHCERTGDLRGFLCHPCNNQIMKKVDEDPGWFLRAAVYKDTSRFEVSGVWDSGGLVYGTKEYKNARALFDKRKINVPEHKELYDLQEGKCALCGVKKPMRGRSGLHIDHCHEDNHVRGLLCMRCNRNLMPVIDKTKHLVFKAFEYKAKKAVKQTVWRRTKLTKLALRKKEKCEVIRFSKTDLIELLLRQSGWSLSEEELRSALVEIDGHDPSKKVHNHISRLFKRLPPEEYCC